MISRIGRSPMGVFVRSAMGALTTMSDVILFDDFRVVTQAAPTTVPSATNILEAYCDNNGSYTPITGGKKLVGKLKRPLKAKASAYALMVLGNLIDVATASGYDNLAISCTINSTSNSPQTNTITGTVRARPVLQDFDQTLSTWNLWESTPPTLGTAITYDKSYGSFLGNIVNTGSLTPLQRSSLGTFKIPRTDDIYGFYFDLKPTVVIDAIRATLFSTYYLMKIILDDNAFVYKIP